MPKHFFRLLFFPCLILILFTFGCKRKPEIATKFYEYYHNKVYQDFDTSAYHSEFNHQLSLLKPQLHYAKNLTTYYKGHEFEPHFVDHFLFNGQLRTLIKYLKSANEHGLNASVFKADKIERDLDTIEANHFTKIANVYPVLARLEIETATALLSYSSILQYGIVNPHTLYRRYDMITKRPDSLLFKQAYMAENLQAYLDQIQPKDGIYQDLKKELATLSADTTNTGAIQQIRTIKLNMERLRWQIPAKDARYIRVNIPAFKLQWIENNKPVFEMKVCVGQAKPADYDARLLNYLKTNSIDDKPANHETTILNSRINTIQLNPTWNIPNSIAQTEIYSAILKDPDYLVNNNIRVYYKEHLVANPDSIDWNQVSRERMPYKFKQDASDLNALGKFKFIFDNENSIYLHDTPNKSAFAKKIRAVSHGCVRVQDPLKLTEALVGDTSRVDNIRMEVGMKPQNARNEARYEQIQLKRSAEGFELKSKYMGLKPDMQLFIDYYTCWPDESGKLIFYDDVYSMDGVLEKAMGKYLGR